MSVFEAHVGAAQSLATEAFALAREQHIGLDPIDREVLTDRLHTASLYLTSLIAAMLPEGEDDASAVAAVGSCHRPRVEAREPGPRAYLTTLTRVGLRHCRKAYRLLERYGIKDESRVKKSVVSAAGHLRIARYLVDGRRRRNEAMEELLRECRELVRRRRDGGNEVTAV